MPTNIIAPSRKHRPPIHGDEVTFHLLDFENLVGDGKPTVDQFHSTMRRYQGQLRPGDFGRLAMSKENVRRLCFELPHNSPITWIPKLRSGRDAADDLLLDFESAQDLAKSYGRVTIASGDGKFAPFVNELRRLGVHVTVVFGVGWLNNELRREATVVRSIWCPVEPQDRSVSGRRNDAALTSLRKQTRPFGRVKSIHLPAVATS